MRSAIVLCTVAGMLLVIYLLACYGFCNAVAVLHVGQPIRALAARIGPRFVTEYGKVTTWPAVLVGCVACLGFWAGLAVSYFGLFASPALPYVELGKYARINAAVIDGLCACAFNFGAHWITQFVYAAQGVYRQPVQPCTPVLAPVVQAVQAAQVGAAVVAAVGAAAAVAAPAPDSTKG